MNDNALEAIAVHMYATATHGDELPSLVEHYRALRLMKANAEAAKFPTLGQGTTRDVRAERSSAQHALMEFKRSHPLVARWADMATRLGKSGWESIG